MAWDSSILATLVKSGIDVLTNEEKIQSLPVHTAWSDAISEFILDHILISGLYSGTISGPLSDPLNGLYKWKPFSITISGSLLMSSAYTPPHFSPWINAIILGIKSVTFIGEDIMGSIVTTVPVLLSTYICTINQAIMNVFNRDECIDYICEQIIIGLQSVTSPIPIVSAATSISPGNGGVTFSVLEQY